MKLMCINVDQFMYVVGEDEKSFQSDCSLVSKRQSHPVEGKMKSGCWKFE